MRTISWLALAASSIGAVGWAIGLAAEPRRALAAWLFAFTFAMTVALGALLLVLLLDVAGATWFAVLRPTATAVASMVPLVALFFLPVLLGAGVLYPWASLPVHRDPHELEQILQARRWLTHEAFAARAVLYLGAWSVLAVLVRRARAERRRAIGGVGALVVALTVSWASFEWLMSLRLGWGSTVYGMIFCVSAFLAGTSLVAVVAWLERRKRILPAGTKPDHFHALGRLVLVGVALWAYTQFSQVFLVWIGDIPKEVTFYLDRTRGAWARVNWVLVFGHFLLPLFALLLRRIKRRSAMLAAVCGWLLVMHLVAVAWLVLPSFAAWPSPVDLAALAAVVGFPVAFALRLYTAADVIPRPDPALAAALRYQSP